jgi:hypothetical protein
MLGTDRPSVSVAAGVLQKKGLIEYTGGAVKILNRKKLEDSACECYPTVRWRAWLEISLDVKSPVLTCRLGNVVVDKSRVSVEKVRKMFVRVEE